MIKTQVICDRSWALSALFFMFLTWTNMEKAASDDTVPKCPFWNPKPTATLLEHSEGAALPSQQKINEYWVAEAAKQATWQSIPTAAASSAAMTLAPDDIPLPTPSSSHEPPERTPGIWSICRPLSGKRRATLLECEELDDNGDEIGGVSVSDVLPGKCKPYLFDVNWIHSWQP
jgi:hypothetical protein